MPLIELFFMATSHTLFISDLHLSPDTPETATLLIHFLKHIANKADALYILGDFFECWVGDDDRSDFNERIKTALRHYTHSGIKTYFMPGNRDFLIGPRFAKETGITLLKEPTLITLYGQRILLLHGDSLCTLDQKHQRSRKSMHNRFYQKIVLSLLPLTWRRHYGQRLRRASIERKSQLAHSIMDVTPEAVTHAMSEARTQLLIHGHTHRPAIHSLSINGSDADAQRIVLGDWHHRGSYLKIDTTGQRVLLEIP